MPQFDVAYVRSQFPALKRMVDGHPVAYFDAPGGTQTPQSVVDAVAGYLLGHNSNVHGCFAASAETDEIIDGARRACADFLGCDWSEISFGANMTTLNFLLADALARELGPGDEVVVTALDHEANRGPWLRLAERDVVIHEVPVDLATCTLDWEHFEAIVKPGRTKVVAVGYASNAVGTVNDVARAARLARSAGAFSVVDAVHYALHGPIDVREIGCDVLLCSAYKFFGPHVGVQYTRFEVAERIRALRLRTQEEEPPYKFETGTLCQEGLEGVTAAVDFIADMGRHHEELVADRLPEGVGGRRRDVIAGMLANELYEQPLARRLMDELSQIPGVTLYGPPAGHPRTSTVSFTIDGVRPEGACRVLGEQGLFLWDGHFYAVRLVERLGLMERGGLVRVGLCPYTTWDELERLIAGVAVLTESAQ